MVVCRSLRRWTSQRGPPYISFPTLNYQKTNDRDQVSDKKPENKENVASDVHVIDEDTLETVNEKTESDGNQAQNFSAELEQAKNDYLYLKAEFDNFRKNAIKERSDLLKFGSERIIVELLEVIDNFDRALETEVTADNFKSFKEGVEMTAHELKAVLTNFGVTEIYPSGLPFDPMTHEALSSEATNDIEPGHVCRVFKKAYKLHDRVIRPAQVIVAKEISEKD